MRGLKRECHFPIRARSLSHLLQMRGLKPKIPPKEEIIPPVASFTDAWIETGLIVSVYTSIGRIFYRCVD